MEILSRNLGPKAALVALSKDIGLPLSKVEARAFFADHFLMEWLGQRLHRLARGQKTVPATTITRARTAEMAGLKEDRLLAHVAPTGMATCKC